MSNMNQEEKELSFGGKAVGLSFNPSQDPDVAFVKDKFAEIIDFCNAKREEAGKGEKGRLYSIAITESQAAQMWAVKAITWKD